MTRGKVFSARAKVIRSIGSRTLTALIYTPDTCVEVSAGVSCLACPVNKTSFTTRTRLNFYDFGLLCANSRGRGGGMGIDGRRGVGRDGVNRGAVRGGGGRV